MEVGSLLLSSGAGTETGVLENFFSVVNSIYNFESQTIEVKKSFLAKAEYIYEVAAGFAYNYCLATDDTANATAVKEQLSSVNKLFTKMWDLISEAETRASAGTDILLVTNQKISKNMLSYNVTVNQHFSYEVGVNSLNVSLNDLTEIVTRASNRGVSLAQDLTNAGFKNITANKEASGNTAAEYVFITGQTSRSYWGLGALEHIGKSLVGWVESDRETAVTSIVVQQGLTFTSKANADIFYYSWWSNYWKGTKQTITHNYNYVVAFQPA
jgi:hypothetical protein